VLVIAMVTSCSGSPPNTPAAGGTFADATCADLANWAGAMQRAFRSLQEVQQFDPSGGATAEKTKLGTLSLALSDADRATARLSDGISSRRAPDVDNGEQVKKTVVDGLNELRDLGKKARSSIDSYDPQTATPEQADTLKRDLQSVADGVQNTLAQLTPLVADNDQLRSALQNSATCQRAASDLGSS
jgi:hypothetical protein